MKERIAILASGSGTTAEAFIRAGQRGEISSGVGLVICSRKDAGIFQRITDLNNEYKLNIPCTLINGKTHPLAHGESEVRGSQTKAEEAAILAELTSGKFDLIVQMGYMRRSGPSIVQAFGWHPDYDSVYKAHMLNTHPGLLPESKGLYGLLVQQHVLDSHLPYSGQTLHVVAENYDEGPIITEHKVRVKTSDTPESLFERVQAIEKEMLPKDIQNFITAQRAYLGQYSVN
jgi:phosphoribosylglycinamide formyltransferase-1